MRKSSMLGAAAMAGVLVWNSLAALAGPVQIISQDRQVEAIARPSGGGEPVVVEIKAPDNGLFQETATADASGEGFISRATATQTSRIGDDGLHFAGTLSWETQDDVNFGEVDSATALAFVLGNVRFRLDQPYDFTFTFDLDVTEQASGAEEPEGSQLLLFEDRTIPLGSGTLQPGEYFLDFFRSTENNVSGPANRHSINYALDLNLTPVDNGGGGPGGNPIPLPPAAWAGLATLACYGASRALAWRWSRGAA